REAEPEGGPELEVPGGPRGSRRCGLGRGVPRQDDRVRDVVARPGHTGLEEERRLVVPHLLVARVVVGVGAQGGPALTERLAICPRGAGGGGDRCPDRGWCLS